MLTGKQEAFARLIAAGETQADAYREAYSAGKMSNRSIWVNASKLAASAKVALRVEELRDEAAKACVVSIEEHLSILRRLRDQAAASKQYAAAIRAEELAGKVSGYYIERHERRDVPAFSSPDAIRERQAQLDAAMAIRKARERA